MTFCAVKILGDLLILLCSLLAGVLVVSAATKTPLVLLLKDFWLSGFLPNKNTAVFETASAANPLGVYYLAIVFALLFLWAIKAVSRNAFSAGALVFRFRTQAALIVSVLVVSQTVGQARYFRTQVDKFSGKSLAQKISCRFKNSYAFAQYCKKHLPGRHVCRPVTGTDISPHKNMLTYIAVQYYLYPLDIVTGRPGDDFDCAVIFLEDHPREHVPPSFTAMPAFDAKSLIAVKGGDRP